MTLERVGATLCFAALAVTLGLAACGADDEAQRRSPENATVLDWRDGTYEGVRLGDDTARLIRVIGRPEKRGRDEPHEPIDEDFYDIGGLTNFSSPNLAGGGESETLRYSRRVFSTTSGKVTSWGTTEDRAETPEGVGVGDSQQLVERRYPEADCFVQNADTEYVTYPLCRVRVCKGRLLGFGGDPIKSIWLAAETRTGLESCQLR